MNTKRSWTLGAVPLALALVGVALIVWQPNQIDRSAYDKISVGMHKRDVHRLVGLPPGNYSTAPVKYAYQEEVKEGVVSPECVQWDHWDDGEGSITVLYDEQGNVLYKSYSVSRDPGRFFELFKSLLDRFW
jgi:hypothetical protein